MATAPKKVSKWWDTLDAGTKKEVLLDSKFHRTDIKAHKLNRKTLAELSAEGWKVSSVVKSCKEWMKFEKEFEPVVKSFMGLANSLGPEWKTLEIGGTTYERTA